MVQHINSLWTICYQIILFNSSNCILPFFLCSSLHSFRFNRFTKHLQDSISLYQNEPEFFLSFAAIFYTRTTLGVLLLFLNYEVHSLRTTVVICLLQSNMSKILSNFGASIKYAMNLDGLCYLKIFATSNFLCRHKA